MSGNTTTVPEMLTHTLRHKVEHAGNAWTEITLRPPTFGELSAAQQEETADLEAAALIESIAKVERAAVELMDYRDVRIAHRYLLHLAAGPLRPGVGKGEDNAPLPEALTITLRHPVKLNGDTVTQMALRPPRLGEVVNARRAPNKNASAASLIAQVARVKLPMIDLMDCRDVREADDYLAPFVSGSPRTGAS